MQEVGFRYTEGNAQLKIREENDSTQLWVCK